MTPVEIHQRDSPIVLSLPHSGTYVPGSILADLNKRGQGLTDNLKKLAEPAPILKGTQ